jgi:hypothetical protein
MPNEMTDAERLFHESGGTDFQRLMIVGAMLPLSSEEFQTERDQLPPDDQILFTISYAACMTWAVQKGIECVLAPEAVKSTVTAIESHLSKQHWFRHPVFPRILDKMQEVMPNAFSPGGLLPET